MVYKNLLSGYFFIVGEIEKVLRVCAFFSAHFVFSAKTPILTHFVFHF